MTLNSGNGGRGSNSSNSATTSARRVVSAATKRPTVPTRDVVQVDPDTAKKWLDVHNSVNRTLTWTRVQELAERMDNGEWHLNGECLKFDEHGNLFEGQHRLNAVILHGKPVWFEVIRGLPYEDRFNDGGKPRTLGDYIVIAGIVEPKFGLKTAAIVEIVGSLLEGAPRGFQSSNSQHKGEVIALAREYRKSILWAIDMFPQTAYAPMVGAFTFAHHSKPAQTDKFARYFLSVERSTGSPAVALTNMIQEANTSGKNNRPYRLEIAQRTLSALFADAKGTKLGVLRRNVAALKHFGAAPIVEVA